MTMVAVAEEHAELLVPVSLLFMRDADRRLFRVKREMELKSICTEEGILLHLSVWGRLPNCHDVSYVATLPGHGDVLMSGQIVIEYVHESFKHK